MQPLSFHLKMLPPSFPKYLTLAAIYLNNDDMDSSHLSPAPQVSKEKTPSQPYSLNEGVVTHMVTNAFVIGLR